MKCEEREKNAWKRIPVFNCELDQPGYGYPDEIDPNFFEGKNYLFSTDGKRMRVRQFFSESGIYPKEGLLTASFKFWCEIPDFDCDIPDKTHNTYYHIATCPKCKGEKE